MNLIDLAGNYRGDVTWFDSFGESRSLSEITSVKPLGGGDVVEGAAIEYQDGSVLRLEPVDGVRGLFAVRRDVEGPDGHQLSCRLRGRGARRAPGENHRCVAQG